LPGGPEGHAPAPEGHAPGGRWNIRRAALVRSSTRGAEWARPAKTGALARFSMAGLSPVYLTGHGNEADRREAG